MPTINILDRFVEAVSPNRALHRAAARKGIKIINGYENGAASRSKPWAKGWRTTAKSPREDINPSLDVMRARSRDLSISAPIASAAVKRVRTNVVGTGLKLRSHIDAEFLDMTPEQAAEWKRNVEREFALWAESPSCDSTGLNNFYELQQVAMVSWLANGDAFAVLKQHNPNPYGLRVHLVEADLISTPTPYITSGTDGKTPGGNRIVAGVEIDDEGAVIAYWVSNRYPHDLFDRAEITWQRVAVHGEKTGERQILHLIETERPGSYRAAPFLAPIIEQLKQISRFSSSELTAAEINALLAVFIESETGNGDALIGTDVPPQEQAGSSLSEADLGSGTIAYLNPGEKASIVESKRPNSNFDAFVKSVCTQIGAALEIPRDLLLLDFSRAYSASRAALLEAWKAFSMRRTWLANDFCKPIFERWLAEAVAMGRIQAPGFFDDPVIRRAYSRAEWIGPAPGQLDPTKEVKAATDRILAGLSTHEAEAAAINGSYFPDNVAQLARENQMMKEAGINAETISYVPEPDEDNGNKDDDGDDPDEE